MKNTVQNGVNDSDMIAPYALKSGDGFLDGVEFAVASTDAASGAAVVGVTQGIFTLPAAAVNGTRKTKAYWDATNKVVTNVSSGNTQIGVFQKSFTSSALKADVKLRWVA
jgi:predicted RecA/RadA family phage recombinase